MVRQVKSFLLKADSKRDQRHRSPSTLPSQQADKFGSMLEANLGLLTPYAGPSRSLCLAGILILVRQSTFSVVCVCQAKGRPAGHSFWLPSTFVAQLLRS